MQIIANNLRSEVKLSEEGLDEKKKPAGGQKKLGDGSAASVPDDELKLRVDS